MQRNSVQHVIERFLQRFPKTIEYKMNYKKNELKFNDDDYLNIWNICKDDSIGHKLEIKPKTNNKAKSYRKIIVYKKLTMWVVFTTKQKKPKTIYPTRKNDKK